MTDQSSAAQAAMADGSVDGVALSLSGGGYRAMMYHVGVLWRLNEVGLLAKLDCISSVSGGSIVAGALGLAWKTLGFDNGVAQNFPAFVDKMRPMAQKTVDAGAVVGGIFLPGTISDRVASAYDSVLYKGATLQDLPDDFRGEGPRFVINATSVQTGALFRFSRSFMGDYRIGSVKAPTVPLCKAVAASSAFPPILSPTTLKIDQPVAAMAGADLSMPPFTQEAVLTDGGVYDNLGLETVKRYKTLLVSDAGNKMVAEGAPRHDWASHAVRILMIIDNQVRSLRKRQLVDSYKRGEHDGCYWGIRADREKYAVTPDPLDIAKRDAIPLADLATRLEKLPRATQDKLMNWGYAVCDAALRRHIDPQLQAKLGITISPPTGFPFPGGY